MKRTNYYLLIGSLAWLVACGGSEGNLAEKKNQLQSYKDEVEELEVKIASLEEEIAAQDTNFVNADKATLVTTVPVPTKTFRHFLEVRGSVTSDRNVTISAETPATVEQVAVEEGQKVRKGQLLVKQNAETLQRNIEELETSLELATTRFERQQKLWDQQIGTEIQFLEAKNAKETLERRIASSRSQLKNYRIQAPFAGTIDDIYIKEGEVAQPGTPLVQLVSLRDMFIEADVSESHLGKFNIGDSVQVRLPSLDKSLISTVSAISEVINPNNRTFTLEVKLPNDAELLRPNLLAVLRIQDFRQPNAVVVPTNLILSDNRGDYVYVAEEQNGQLIATKKMVERGMTYNNETLVRSGLSGDEQLIDEGFRDVAEGIRIKQAETSAITSNR